MNNVTVKEILKLNVVHAMLNAQITLSIQFLVA